MQALDRKFVKTYDLSATNREFTHTKMVRHQGTVIAFAMDNKQQIYYTVLDMDQDNAMQTPDADCWTIEPQRLPFPREIAQIGYGAAGVQSMPVVRKDGTVLLPGASLSLEETDAFLSSTARLTADAPFQVLSDEKHVYVFRQSIARDHSRMVKQNDVAIVDNTLLLDRFVYRNGTLKLKLEVRYQRSRKKDIPANRKDALGYEDLEKKPFYEPTQELDFIRNLEGGKFNALLVPTHLPDVQRWQIFAYNSKTQRMDSFNIERSTDGLFNTKGTRYYTSPEPEYQKDVYERNPAGFCPFTNKPLIPLVSESGFAESALQFDGLDDYGRIPAAEHLKAATQKDFTVEVWLKADPVATPLETDTRSILDAGTGEGAFPYAIRYINAGADVGKVQVERSDGSNRMMLVSKRSISDGKFHHCALVKQGAELVLYLDGDDVGKTTDTYASNAATRDSLFLGSQNGKAKFFSGQIDEVRLWSRARSPKELVEEMHYRLVGNESELVGYWRMDEGAGTVISDQTDAANHGQLVALNPGTLTQLESNIKYLNAELQTAEQQIATIRYWAQFNPEVQRNLTEQEELFRRKQSQLAQLQQQQQKLKQQQVMAAKTLWIKSTAPVGEHPGIRRSSFSIAGRTIATGCTALLYYQQEQAETGYTAIEKKPIKRNARVMFAVATAANPPANSAKNQIAVLDFAVSRAGSLAQVADTVTLPLIDKSTVGSDSLNPELEKIQKLEADILKLRTDISNIEQSRVTFTFESYTVGDSKYAPRSLEVGIHEGFPSEESLQFAIDVPPSLEVTLDWIPYQFGQKPVLRTDVITGGTTFRPFNAIPGIWIGMVKRLTVRQAAAGYQSIMALYKQLMQQQSELDGMKDSLMQEVKLAMPFLQADPEGLTVMGALLGFTWTDRAPLLFESVNGRLSLYFKGQDTHEFFAAYYDVLVGRASFTLLTKTQIEHGSETNLVEGGAIKLIARTAGEVLQGTTIAITPTESNPKACTVTLTNTTMGITETWQQVPRDVQSFTAVLNGLAQPLLIGELAASLNDGDGNLAIKGRLNYAVTSGATLLIGKDRIKVTVSGEVPKAEVNAPTVIPINPIATQQKLAAAEPVYLLPYDYETYAQVTAPIVMRSLEAGSLLVLVDPNQAVGDIQNGVAAIKEPAQSGQWFADSQGSAFSLEEGPTMAKASETRLPKCVLSRDLTLEAWINPNEPTGNTARIITQYFVDAAKKGTGYTLGLQKDGQRYKVFADVNGKTVQTVTTIAPFKQTQDEWVHLAAVFNQSYALRFNGNSDRVECGSDITLDITGDLTIEAFIQTTDMSRKQGILRKGKLGDGMPYALSLNQNHLEFAFEDENGTLRTFKSNDAIRLTPNTFYKVAVTRERAKPTIPDDSGDSSDSGKPPKFSTKQSYLVKLYIQGMKLAGSPDHLVGSSTYADASPRSSNASCVIAEKISDESVNFRGDIAEVRVWNAARPERDLFTRITGNEKGLVSWWQFEENEGNLAYDSKSNNHGTRIGATWIKSPDPNSSELLIYCNGEKQRTESRSPVLYEQPQFVLGARVTKVINGMYYPDEYFKGQMDEIRVWNVARTEQQIQDNLFRRLMNDFEQLIAYYDCDPYYDGDRRVSFLADRSGQQIHVKIFGINSLLSKLSTAPISNEAAVVRSALSGVKTTFHAAIASTPAVQEYGDMQTDHDGNLTAVMKRCYAYIKDSKWQLITGFKVGDLELEWIGQAQYDPQLKGFIEGAPPVPSENLTIRDANQGEVYDEASSVQLASADSVFYTYSTSKERGIDTALSLQAGLGVQSKSDAGFGMTTEVESTNIMVGMRGNMETSNSWLSDQTVGVGKATSRFSRLNSQGAWEKEGQLANKGIGRRYVPKNVGFALVESETADVFALRLKHRDPDKRITVALKMRPNPDIPRDWNIIMFPINPRYTKQGTLDGKIGLEPDPDYPGATEYSSDLSYFKPQEAYQLKRRIEQEQKELEADYQDFATDPAGIKGMKIGAGAGGIGAITSLAGAGVGSAIGGGIAFNQKSKLPSLSKMNLFNTYVWTADGGLFAETQQFSTVQQDVTAGSFSLSGMAGLFTSVNTAIAKVAVGFELEALMGGHLNLTTSKTAEASSSFGVEVTLDVERDIRVRDADQAKLVGAKLDEKCPGKVDGYRFMIFYLEPDKEHFNDFSSKIVDRTWLDQSTDPNAAALKQAIDQKNGTPWRILHRVTYVSRVLPEIGSAKPGSVEEKLRAANIESNWELVKRLEPYVPQSKRVSYAELKAAVEQAIDLYLPELVPAKPDIVEYMSQYYQRF